MREGAGSSTGYFIVSVSYLLVILTIEHALFQNSLQFHVPANCCQDWRQYRILKFQSSRISVIQTARFFFVFFTALLSALPPLRFAAWGVSKFRERLSGGPFRRKYRYDTTRKTTTVGEEKVCRPTCNPERWLDKRGTYREFKILREGGAKQSIKSGKQREGVKPSVVILLGIYWRVFKSQIIYCANIML